MRTNVLLFGLTALLATSPLAQTTSTNSVTTPAAHGPDHHGHALHGTVDSANLVSVEEMAKLGVDSARKLYAGKIVTFLPDFAPVGVRAKNERKKNVCMQGFSKWLKPRIGTFENVAVRVFFNYGNEIHEWLKYDPHNPADIELDNPLQLTEDVCDSARVCTPGDQKRERRCIFSSDRLLISGKIMAINAEAEGRGFVVFLRPTGLRY
jgi:hypothetical protein